MSRNRLTHYVMKAVAIYVLFVGVIKFDNAEQWVPLVQGLFWIFVGGIVLWTLPSTKQED